MTRQKIQGYGNHDQQEELKSYGSYAPSAVWSGRLDFLAWGKSTNLFCFFSDIQTGEKYRLSVFSRSSYKPYQGSIAFDQEPIGGIFEITTQQGESQKPSKFMSAEKLQADGTT